MESKSTESIVVQVESAYLPSQSNPRQNQWFFVYHVTIQNTGTLPVQLLSRHWVVTNARGEEQHVRGPGVVGNQPLILPGQEFSYTSGCPLDTSMGSMHGSYQMVDSEGQQFDARIAPFVLVNPMDLN